jgi:formylglycine-generating enzyme required for sulfatase activity
MVEVSTPNGQRYCIDATEVTQSDYQEFLLYSHDKPGAEHELCDFNTSYEPNIMVSSTAPGGGCLKGIWTPTTTPQHPVSCVDWCDAYAFCQWAGKRLCGKVGGGEEPTESGNDPNASQWYNACSQGGTTTYSYGNEFDPAACSGAVLVPDSGTPDYDAGVPSWTPSDAGSWEGCRGSETPWSGVFDLSGSVREWTDSCAYYPNQVGGGHWSCRVRGGDFMTGDSEYYACADPATSGLEVTHMTIGFRCCKDLD